MDKHTFSIPNISCDHCINAIKNELSELAGVKSVKGDLKNKTATVEWENPASIHMIKQILKEMGYPDK